MSGQSPLVLCGRQQAATARQPASSCVSTALTTGQLAGAPAQLGSLHNLVRSLALCRRQQAGARHSKPLLSAYSHAELRCHRSSAPVWKVAAAKAAPVAASPAPLWPRVQPGIAWGPLPAIAAPSTLALVPVSAHASAHAAKAHAHGRAHGVATASPAASVPAPASPVAKSHSAPASMVVQTALSWCLCLHPCCQSPCPLWRALARLPCRLCPHCVHPYKLSWCIAHTSRKTRARLACGRSCRQSRRLCRLPGHPCRRPCPAGCLCAGRAPSRLRPAVLLRDQPAALPMPAPASTARLRHTTEIWHFVGSGCSTSTLSCIATSAALQFATSA